MKWEKIGLVAGGVLFGTAGIALLKSDDAKNAYTHVTAAVKRCGSAVMETATTLKENCEDINADANDINEYRAKKKEEREIADAIAKIEAYEAKKAEEAEAEARFAEADAKA